MNGNNVKPYAIMVFGVPKSGKTEFSSKFSRQFKAPFLNFNAIPGISQKSFLSLVTQITHSQQNLLIEGCLGTVAQRTKLRNLLTAAGYRPVLLWIQTDVNVIKRRLKAELGTVEKAKAFFDQHIKELEAPEDAERPIVISGKHTYDDQLKSVLACLAKL